MVRFWMNWCRLCSREDTCNSHINVLLKDEEDLSLTATINKYFSIAIDGFNNFPVMICLDCYRLIRATFDLNQRVTKASAMFAELQVLNEDEFDVHTIKARHNLQLDFRPFENSPSESNLYTETKRKLLEVDEPMIDQDLSEFNKTEDSNPINVKIEEDEEIDVSLHRHSEESSSSSQESVDRKETPNPRKKKYRTKKELLAENQSKPHYCSECSKGFKKFHNYRRHMQSAHGVETEQKPMLFICENCGKEYKSMSALKEHEHSHTEERTLKCKYCEKAFKGIPSLRLHEDTHNETNYICVVCGLQLNTQRTLRMHMAVHSDRRKHKCDHCGSEFKRAKALKSHLILHTGLKPYSCDFCDRTFASGSNCRSHKKKNHPEELAAQEAAGKKSTTRIPKLSELKAVTAAIVRKTNDVAVEDVQKYLLDSSLKSKEHSFKQESEVFDGILSKKCC